jgi:hypothetical protein
VQRWLARHRDMSFWGPGWSDLLLWFAAGLGVYALAVVLALPIARQRAMAVAFVLVVSTLLGGLAMPIVTELCQRLILTWPAALFAAFMAMTAAGVRAARDSRPATAATARAAGLILVGLSALYYLGCQRLSLLAGWGFLLGFVPAWPMAVGWARRLLAGRGLGQVTLWGLVSYTVYFWSSALAYLWRARLF